jgi:hypothetical protein
VTDPDARTRRHFARVRRLRLAMAEDRAALRRLVAARVAAAVPWWRRWFG